MWQKYLEIVHKINLFTFIDSELFTTIDTKMLCKKEDFTFLKMAVCKYFTSVGKKSKVTCTSLRKTNHLRWLSFDWHFLRRKFNGCGNIFYHKGYITISRKMLSSEKESEKVSKMFLEKVFFKGKYLGIFISWGKKYFFFFQVKKDSPSWV